MILLFLFPHSESKDPLCAPCNLGWVGFPAAKLPLIAVCLLPESPVMKSRREVFRWSPLLAIYGTCIPALGSCWFLASAVPFPLFPLSRQCVFLDYRLVQMMSYQSLVSFLLLPSFPSASLQPSPDKPSWHLHRPCSRSSIPPRLFSCPAPLQAPLTSFLHFACQLHGYVLPSLKPGHKNNRILQALELLLLYIIQRLRKASVWAFSTIIL